LARHRHHRRDIHDGTAALSTHGGHHGLAAVPHALHVDCEDAVPLGRVDVLEIGQLDLAKVGCVVDQAVYAAESLQGGRGHGLRGRVVGHIGAHVQRLSAGPGDEVHGLVGRAHVGHHDARALGAASQRKCLANAGGRTGDDDGPAVEQRG